MKKKEEKMKSLGNVKINGQIKQVSVQKDGETYKYFLDNECIGAYNQKLWEMI